MKYMIKPLEALCVNSLLKDLDRDEIEDEEASMFFAKKFFTIFQFCVDCSVDKRLMEKCGKIIRSEWGELIWGDGKVRESFLKISQKCLIRFLDNDFLNARDEEICLFSAVCFYVLA